MKIIEKLIYLEPVADVEPSFERGNQATMTLYVGDVFHSHHVGVYVGDRVRGVFSACKQPVEVNADGIPNWGILWIEGQGKTEFPADFLHYSCRKIFRGDTLQFHDIGITW